MDTLINIFTRHPKSNNQTYFEHFNRSIYFSLKMFYGSVALLIHSFFPFVCEKTGSNIVCSLKEEMNKK